MKRILLLMVLVLLGTSAFAQYIPDGPLQRRGSHLRAGKQTLTSGQQSLVLSDIDGVDYNKAWDKAAVLREKGNRQILKGSLCIVGGAVGLVGGYYLGMTSLLMGVIGAIDETNYGFSNGAMFLGPVSLGLFFLGLNGAVTGLFMVPIGIYRSVSGSTKMNHIVKYYNMGLTDNGIGLSFNF